jgi:hypothetical protein
LTLSVALGLALSLRWQSARWPRLLTNDLHRFVTLLTLVFTAVHGLAAWLDPFMRFGWTEMLVPLASHYRPRWMAMGILAGYLALAIWISSELRSHIGYKTWRRLHTLTFAVYLLATLHGIATGTDTHAAWALALYAGSGLLVGRLLLLRLLTPIGARGRTSPGLAGITVLILVLGGVWTLTGPTQRGWNAIADGVRGNGTPAAGAIQAPGGTRAGGDPFAYAFAANVQGTASQTAPDAAGNSTLRVEMTLSGEVTGTAQLRATITNASLVPGATNTLVLTGRGNTPRYTGTLQWLQGGMAGWDVQATLKDLEGQTLLLNGELWSGTHGQVTGTVEGTPVA